MECTGCSLYWYAGCGSSPAGTTQNRSDHGTDLARPRPARRRRGRPAVRRRHPPQLPALFPPGRSPPWPPRLAVLGLGRDGLVPPGLAVFWLGRSAPVWTPLERRLGRRCPCALEPRGPARPELGPVLGSGRLLRRHPVPPPAGTDRGLLEPGRGRAGPGRRPGDRLGGRRCPPGRRRGRLGFGRRRRKRLRPGPVLPQPGRGDDVHRRPHLRLRRRRSCRRRHYFFRRGFGASELARDLSFAQYEHAIREPENLRQLG